MINLLGFLILLYPAKDNILHNDLAEFIIIFSIFILFIVIYNSGFVIDIIKGYIRKKRKNR